MAVSAKVFEFLRNAVEMVVMDGLFETRHGLAGLGNIEFPGIKAN